MYVAMFRVRASAWILDKERENRILRLEEGHSRVTDGCPGGDGEIMWSMLLPVAEA